MIYVVFIRSTIIGVSRSGRGCDRIYPGGLFAKITKDVKTWIESVAAGTQDSDCDKQTTCEDCGLELPDVNNEDEVIEKEEANFFESSGSDEDDDNYGFI